MSSTPKFRCREVGGDPDFMTIKAGYAELAAERMAECLLSNSAGESPGPYEIEVTDQVGQVTVWNVEVEYNPSFYASQKAKPGGPHESP